MYVSCHECATSWACLAGKPLFGTLIALVHDGVPVLGVIDQPILKERWVGVAGQVTTLNDKPIATRPCDALADAYMYSTTPLMFEGANLTAYNRLADQVRGSEWSCALAAADGIPESTAEPMLTPAHPAALLVQDSRAAASLGRPGEDPDVRLRLLCVRPAGGGPLRPGGGGGFEAVRLHGASAGGACPSIPHLIVAPSFTHVCSLAAALDLLPDAHRAERRAGSSHGRAGFQNGCKDSLLT